MESWFEWVPGIIWLFAKTAFFMFLFFLMGDVAKGIKSFKKGMASDADDNEPKNISDNNQNNNNQDSNNKD